MPYLLLSRIHPDCMQRLLLLGLNHTTAPLEVREQLAFDAKQRRDGALAAFRAQFAECEAVLLSHLQPRRAVRRPRARTASPACEEMVAFLAEFHGVAAPALFGEHLYHKTDRDVVEHLFTVASSLDSMVLGETQILGQVRDAYDAVARARRRRARAQPAVPAGRSRVGKQVMRETRDRRGPAERRQRRGRLREADLRPLQRQDRAVHRRGEDGGAGAPELRGAVAQAAARLQPRPGEGRGAGRRSSAGEAVPFERLDDHLVAADIVVTSTGSAPPDHHARSSSSRCSAGGATARSS